MSRTCRLPTPLLGRRCGCLRQQDAKRKGQILIYDASMTRIKKSHDGPGRDKTYDIGPRKNIPRAQVVTEIKQGKHPGAHVYTLNNIEFPRDDPDGSTSDNVNRR